MRTQKYLGVYSSLKTKSHSAQKRYFFVWEADKSYVIQRVDNAFQPVTAPECVIAAYLAENFILEPSILVMPVDKPQMFPQRDTSSRSGVSTEPAKAKEPLPHIMKLTESRLRSTFQYALLRLKRPRERKEALNALKELAHTKENIFPKHKHMFRDFGVAMRKNNQPYLAMLFCRRVLELAPNDDHAHFNMARIFCVLGNYSDATHHINKAIELDPDITEYFTMLAHIDKIKQFPSMTNRANYTG